MRKVAVVLVSVLTFAILVPGSIAQAQGPCDEDRFDVRPQMGHAKVERKVKSLIKCAEDRWSVIGGASKAISVAQCESGLWPWASNDGNYLGLFQHSARYWESRVRNLLQRHWFMEHEWERLLRVPQGAFDARANVLVSLRMAHSGGWGPWACA